MGPTNPALALLRGQVLGICVGTAFLVIGLAACVVAALLHRGGGVRVFVWLGTWSAIYGVQEFLRSPGFVAALPRPLQASLPYLSVTVNYLVIVVATLAWMELTRGAVRRLLQVEVAVGLAIAAAAMASFVTKGDAGAAALANTALAVFALLVLLALLSLPDRLAVRYLVLPHRGVLFAGTLFFALEALYSNLANTFGLPHPRPVGWLGFAVLLFSFGYVALHAVVDSERRLRAIESELAVARRLQLAILPAAVPQLAGVCVAAAYQPMTAVAGDFYEFIAVDRHRAGFLVADVSGHGVPAALIASMIKVAVQSVAAWAHDPSEFLGRLRATLEGHLRGQYVTAAYLWLDAGSRTARYAAAGHPPLLHWREAAGTAERVESNGLLFGVPVDSDYPAREISFDRGDRFLLYTDGLTESESEVGQPFGEARLEQVLREGRARPAEELKRLLLAAVGSWRPTSLPQQDDITFVVVDVV